MPLVGQNGSAANRGETEKEGVKWESMLQWENSRIDGIVIDS